VTEDCKQREHREKEEKKRMRMYLQLQSSEIQALKAELLVLKRKDVPPLPHAMQQQQPLNSSQGESQSPLTCV
jgi:hypothetical protein